MNLVLDSRSKVFLLGSMVLFILYVLFSSLFGSKLLGASALLILSVAVGVASNLKMEYRAEPLYPSEVTMISELPFLMDMVGLQLSLIIISGLLLCIISLFFVYRWYSKKVTPILRKRENYILRILGVFFTSICLIYITRFNEPDHKLKEFFGDNAHWVTYNQPKNYTDNGFVAGFLYNFEAAPMEEIPDYSKEKIDELVEKYRLISEEINMNRQEVDIEANLIFVMNESFSDPLRLEGFQTDRDPFNYFRDLNESTLSGHSLAQSIGGGTANSEFEALTTLSLEPLAVNITTPYVQLTDQMDNAPSVAKFMKEHGHYTSAIHSHSPRLYKRRDVYNSLGFDQFLYDENMRHTETLENSSYISDASAYREVIDVLNDTPERDFIHLVTMQNHMSYASKHETVYFDSSGSENDDEANGYLQDLYYSDQFLEFFIDEIDAFEEPTILVFWGDHLPGFYGSYIGKNNSRLVRHETPLLIYANYKELQGELGTISPVFFMNHVLDILNIQVTPHQALLKELEDSLPAFKDGLYLENGSQFAIELRENLDEQTLDVLMDYHLLQYDITTGRNYAREFGFFDR